MTAKFEVDEKLKSSWKKSWNVKAQKSADRVGNKRRIFLAEG